MNALTSPAPAQAAAAETTPTDATAVATANPLPCLQREAAPTPVRELALAGP